MFLQKLKITFGVLGNKLNNSCTTPLERLEYGKDLKQKELRELLEQVATLGGSITEFERNQKEYAGTIEKATKAAEAGVRQGFPDAEVKKILIRKNATQARYDANEKLLADTKVKFEALKLRIKEYEAQIEDIKLQIIQLQTETKMASVKVKIAEATTGIGENDYNINNDLVAGREIVNRDNSRADAMMELSEQGVFDGVKAIGNPDANLDKIIAESAAETELAAIKAKITGLENKMEE